MASQSLSVTAAAEARHSVRKYTDQPVSTETINEVLRVAGLAPSPFNIQPWRVIVVRNKEKLQQLQAAAYGQPQVGASAFTLVLYSDLKDTLANVSDIVHPGIPDKESFEKMVVGSYGSMEEKDQEQLAFAESNIFLGYLLLALQEAGLGSSPMLGFAPDQVKELFGLPAHVQVPALIAAGYPAEEGFPSYRHKLDRFVTFVD